ncbi:MAG TPA: acetyl ornithine aminotransferase family protein [Candidatus Hydrothermia bacterium]|nr:acetyl ornithine aminotransferase family protein [Candidatus Hydrothermia bacterium]
MLKPEIKTSLPGPKSKELLKKDEEYVSPSYTRSYPAVIDRGSGVWAYDVDGNRFLDMTAGIAVLATGHCHPEIVKVVQEQAEKLIHMSGADFYYPSQIELAEKLAEIAPGSKNKRVFFSNSGAEANEAALKLARYKTKRPIFISFFGAFHGRTFGTVSVSASKAVHRKYFSPMLPQVVHLPYPNPYRPFFGVPTERLTDTLIDYIENYIFTTIAPPEDVAAFIFEPVQGEGGYVVPPSDFFPKLKQLAEKFDILLIDDEVQAGMGRTGKMFAIEHFNVIPDIVTVAKGIASGLPLGATIARKSLMDWESGSHASTFGGNPISCTASLKTIELLEKGLIENAREVGEYLKSELLRMKDEFEFVGDVRGLGLMIGVEIVKDKTSKIPDQKLRNKILNDAFYRGLLILGAGTSTVRWCPAMTVSKEEIDIALDIFRDILKSN